jgi:hypothetical protein
MWVWQHMIVTPRSALLRGLLGGTGRKRQGRGG